MGYADLLEKFRIEVPLKIYNIGCTFEDGVLMNLAGCFLFSARKTATRFF